MGARRWPPKAVAEDVLALKGDILTHDGTGLVRLAVGADVQQLTADSAQTEGLDWDSAIGTHTAVYPLDVIGKGTGATKTTTALVGTTTIGEEFGVGDAVYLHFLFPDYIDRTQDATVEIEWYPTASEVGKKVSWQFDILSTEHGVVVSGSTGIITSTDDVVPATVNTIEITTITLTAATYLAGSIEALHIRIKRIASSADGSDLAIAHGEIFIGCS